MNGLKYIEYKGQRCSIHKTPRVICSVCGGEFPGSLHGSTGDWTRLEPRMHKIDGSTCPGVYTWAKEIAAYCPGDGTYLIPR